jgi:hypothetical protein
MNVLYVDPLKQSLQSLMLLTQLHGAAMSAIDTKISDTKSKSERRKLKADKQSLILAFENASDAIFSPQPAANGSYRVELNCEQCSLQCGYCGKCVYMGDRNFSKYQFH